MKVSKLHFYFFALAARGEGLSGSDRIFIELAKHWSKNNLLEVFVWEEGFQMCCRQHLDKSNVKFNILSLSRLEKCVFTINYIALIIRSILLAFKLNLNNLKSTIIYSASDSWMDSLPGWILKCRYPKITWIGSWYLTVPNPFQKFGGNNLSIKLPRLNSFFHWLLQKPAFYLIKKKADIVFVTSEPDKAKFPKQKNVLVIKGGVDLTSTRFWQKKFKHLPKIYDAVFQGRFHPQKGVLELIDIWKLVVGKKPNAKLIMIGDGPLTTQVKAKIRKYKLEKNIFLTGYKYDGEEKFKIFCQSKIVVHPSIYDSGGMSAAEAMAFGIPCIGFNLPAYSSYYPHGMFKVKLGDKNSFAAALLLLLNNQKKATIIGEQALQMVKKEWDWNRKAPVILKKILQYEKNIRNNYSYTKL